MITFLRRYGLRLIGPILIAWVLLTSDLEQVAASFANVSPARLGSAGLVVLLGVGLKSWRWERLLHFQGLRYPPLRAVATGVYGIALGFLSPGRVGEFLKAAFVRNEGGASLVLGAAGVITDRIFDLVVFFLVLVVGMAFYVRHMTAEHSLLLGFGVAVLGAAACAAAVRFRPRWLPGRLERIFRPVPLGILLAISAAATAAHFLLGVLIAREFGMDLTVWQVGFAVTFASVVAVLPVTIMGIGTREVALIHVLGLFGVDRSGAVSFSLLFFAVNLAVFLAIAGLGSLLLPPSKGRDFPPAGQGRGLDNGP